MSNNIATAFNYGAGDTKGDAKLLSSDLRGVGVITDSQPSAYGDAVINKKIKAEKAVRWNKCRFWLPSLFSVVGGALALINPDFMNVVVHGFTVGPIVLTSLFASVPYLSLLQPWLAQKASKKADEKVESIRGKLLSSVENLNDFIHAVEQKMGVSVDKLANPKLGNSGLSYVEVTYYGEYETEKEDVCDALTGEPVGTKSSKAHVYSVSVGSEKTWLMASRNFLADRAAVKENETVFSEIHGYGPNNVNANESVRDMIEWAEDVAAGVENDPLQGTTKSIEKFYIPVSDGDVAVAFEDVLDKYALNPPARPKTKARRR